MYFVRICLLSLQLLFVNMRSASGGPTTSSYSNSSAKNDVLSDIFNRSVSIVDANRTALIIIGNQATNKAEVYQLTFVCNYDEYNEKTRCEPLPLGPSDLVWSSPVTQGISEIKYVSYKGRPAVLCTTDNGVIIYDYPNGDILFHREIEETYYMNVHSAEVLPDGNVIVAGTTSDGIFAVLYPSKDNNVTQLLDDTVVVRTKIPYGHGVVYDKTRNVVYAAGYLTLLVLEYNSGWDGHGWFKIMKNISLERYYDEADKAEDDVREDGVHDLYPIDGSYDALFLSTGEHVFIIDVNDFSVHQFPNLYTIPSRNSRQKNVAVKDKGGVKSVSVSASNGLVLAKASPWFKEHYKYHDDGNYNVHEPVLLWTTLNNDSATEHCYNPGYDVGDNGCRISFHNLLPNISFYKARVFSMPQFSYTLTESSTPEERRVLEDY